MEEAILLFPEFANVPEVTRVLDEHRHWEDLAREAWLDVQVFTKKSRI